MKTRQTGKRGNLFVVTAPSGTGKTTLVRRVMNADQSIGFSVSYTTRPARKGEVNGEDYNFVTPDEFERMKEDGRFLEYALVFDHWYGTSRDQVDSMLDAGNNVILEIDWQGARQVRKNMPESLGIFILPPSLAILEARLRGRSTDSEAVIARRLSDARDDMSHWNEFDFVIVNDDLDAAVDSMHRIIAGDGAAWSTDDPAVESQANQIEAG